VQLDPGATGKKAILAFQGMLMKGLGKSYYDMAFVMISETGCTNFTHHIITFQGARDRTVERAHRIAVTTLEVEAVTLGSPTPDHTRLARRVWGDTGGHFLISFGDNIVSRYLSVAVTNKSSSKYNFDFLSRSGVFL
jgi:hypothetical protein